MGITQAVDRASPGLMIERHHHENGYAALVLSGGYVEAGDSGRIRAAAGTVLLHQPFEGHFDIIEGCGARILNVELSKTPDHSLGLCADPDSVVRLAERDRTAAADLLIASTQPIAVEPLDWPDLLAAALRDPHFGRIDCWAELNGITPTKLSRGFALAYGVTPKRYRLEQRAAAAARAICSGAVLSETAFANGFSDQPHMTRTVGSVFGRSPGRLRN